MILQANKFFLRTQRSSCELSCLLQLIALKLLNTKVYKDTLGYVLTK